MAARKVDTDFDRAQRGAVAGMVHQDLAGRVAARERKLLAGAIASWRAGQLSGDQARAVIAAIAELRAIVDDLERESRQGQEARERLIGAAPGP